jgi:chromosome segregation ATPase
VVKGLKERVANLTELAREQRDTLEAVRTRAVKMDKLSKDYKQALLDFQEMGKRLDERRNELVAELELANKRKDQELVRLAHLELGEIELKKKSLERLPDLERKLDDTVKELRRQIRIVFPSHSSVYSLLSDDAWSKLELAFLSIASELEKDMERKKPDRDEISNIEFSNIKKL